MKRYCLALDLKDDPELILQYDHYHQDVWPEVRESILASGIREMEIYRVHNRLFMILETEEGFSFDKKAELDRLNPVVQEWEQLMWNFQQPLPQAAAGGKWQLMHKVFEIRQH